MRAMLVLLLAGAAFAALPNASAAELPVGCNQSVGACVAWDVPSDGRECATVHVGFQGGGACASSETGNLRVCTSFNTILSDPCPTDPVWESVRLVDVTCNPDLAGPCVALHATGACAGVNFGLQGAGACADRQDGVRVCTSMRSIFWDGFCPTDGTILDEIIYLP